MEKMKKSYIVLGICITTLIALSSCSLWYSLWGSTTEIPLKFNINNAYAIAIRKTLNSKADIQNSELIKINEDGTIESAFGFSKDSPHITKWPTGITKIIKCNDNSIIVAFSGEIIYAVEATATQQAVYFQMSIVRIWDDDNYEVILPESTKSLYPYCGNTYIEASEDSLYIFLADKNYNNFLWRYEYSTKKFTKYEISIGGHNSPNLVKVILGENNTDYVYVNECDIAGNYAKFYSIDKNSDISEQLFTLEATINDIYKINGKDCFIFIGYFNNDSGIFCLDYKSFNDYSLTKISNMPATGAGSIFQDSNNNVYFRKDDGIYQIEKNNDNVEMKCIFKKDLWGRVAVDKDNSYCYYTYIGGSSVKFEKLNLITKQIEEMHIPNIDLSPKDLFFINSNTIFMIGVSSLPNAFAYYNVKNGNYYEELMDTDIVCMLLMNKY